MRIDLISVQPQMFRGFLEDSIIGRAVDKRLVEINLVDLKQFGIGRWHKTDDKPYGGGPGMLMRCEPWFAALESVLEGQPKSPSTRIIMTSPKGHVFTERDAERFATMVDRLIFLCGHYEGFDARVETLADEFLSIGDFVMTGGELAAAAMVDAIVRLRPGVLGGGAAAVSGESFGADGLLEPPQYTHPPEFRGMKVPEVLLSGDHRRIETWRKSEARRITAELRPDLLK